MKEFFKKLFKKITSRKFILTLLTDIIAIATLFMDFVIEEVKVVAIIVLAVANGLYNIVEGHIDAKAIAQSVIDTIDKVEEIKKEDE